MKAGSYYLTGEHEQHRFIVYPPTILPIEGVFKLLATDVRRYKTHSMAHKQCKHVVCLFKNISTNTQIELVKTYKLIREIKLVQLHKLPEALCMYTI